MTTTEYIRKKFGTGADTPLPTVPSPVSQTEEQAQAGQNNGGVIGGAGYLLEKLGLGALSGIEGIVDYTAGGIAKLFGADEWAEEQFSNDWVDYNHADEWYDPSEGWKVAGDVASGIGSSLPAIGGTAAGAALATFSGGTLSPVAASIISASVAGLGAAGNATKDAYRESGALNGAAFGYGALSGVTEAGVEFLTGGLAKGSGRIVNSIAKKTAKETAETVARTGAKTVLKNLAEDFVTEGIEEGLSEFLSPYYQRMTYDPDAQNASWRDVGYAALVGGLSGALMSGGSSAIGAVSDYNSGSKATENGTVEAIMKDAEQFAAAESKYDTGYEAFKAVREIYTQLSESLAKTGGEVTNANQKMLLGQLKKLNVAATFSPFVERSAQNILKDPASVVERYNALGMTDADGNKLNFTVEQLLSGVDTSDLTSKAGQKRYVKSLRRALSSNSVLSTLAVADATGHIMMDTQKFANAALNGKKVANAADLNNFIENATEEQKTALGAKLGISDWNTATIEQFRAALENYVSTEEFSETRRQLSRMRSAIDTAQASSKPLPHLLNKNRADGTVRYKDESSGVDLAIIKEGDAYYLYDYRTEEISRKMTMQEVNKTLRNVHLNAQKMSEATQKSEASQKRQENAKKSEAHEQVRFALGDTKEKQDFAIEQNIKEVSKMNSVAQLSGEEFKKGETDLVTQVTGFFNSLQNHADNAELGEITLDRRGVKDDIAHGIGRKKAASFAAIPEVVRHGKVVDFQKNWKNRGYDTAVIAAPIDINGVPHFMGVVLISEDSSNRFYVHEVLSTEEGALSFKTGTAKNNGTPGDNAPSVISILQKIANVKRKSLSESDIDTNTSTQKTSSAAQNVQDIDAFAAESVPDYRKLSAPNQSAVRMTIRQAMAHGVSEEDVILYARVAARSGLDVVFDAEQAGSDGVLRGNTIFVNPELSTERTYRTVAGHEMEHVLFRGKKGKRLIADAFRHADAEQAQKVSERYIKFYKKKGLSMEEYLPIVNEEIAAAYGETILEKEGAWEYILGDEPTLEKRVLGFFGKAARDYSFHEGMSREERRFLRIYRKLFAELSERNMGNNALALEAQTGQKIPVTNKNDENVQVTGDNAGDERHAIKFLNEDDLSDYLHAGGRANKYKQQAIDSGKKIILTTAEEMRGYIEKAIAGEMDLPTVAYGRVDVKLSKETSDYSDGQIQISNYYLELVADDIRHAYQEHLHAKERGDIDLSTEDFINIPLYVATYDDFVYAIKYKSGSTKICLSKKISDGRVLVIETVSKSHGSIEFKNMIGVSEKKYLEEYEKKYKKRNSTNTRGSESSNNSLRDVTVSNAIIHETNPKSNTFAENSSNKILDERYALTDEELAQMEPPAEDKQSGRLTGEMLARDIDNYTQKQYNSFGWARYAEALTKTELDDLYSKVQARTTLRTFKQSSKGEAIVEVNKNPHTTLDVDNVFVFVKGTKSNFDITRVVRFVAETETEMELIREDIYEGRSCNDTHLAFYQEEGIAREYRREDFPSFDEYRKRRSNGEARRGADQDHRRSAKYRSGYSLRVGEDGKITERFALTDEELAQMEPSVADKISAGKITANMTDKDRYEVLKDRSISLSARTNHEKLAAVQQKFKIAEGDIEYSKYGNRVRLFKKLGAEFSVFHKYSNRDIKLDFSFSKENMRESVSKQRNNYMRLAKMLTCLDGVIDNAVGIEVHNRNAENYKVDNTLNNVYVLASAFVDGDHIVPVKLEVKEFSDKENTLHVAIALESINKDEIVKQEVAKDSVARQYSPSSTISIADFFRKINPLDESFYKYIPKQFVELTSAGDIKKNSLDERFALAPSEAEKNFVNIEDMVGDPRPTYKAGVKNRDFWWSKAASARIDAVDELYGLTYYLIHAGGISRADAEAFVNNARSCPGQIQAMLGTGQYNIFAKNFGVDSKPVGKSLLNIRARLEALAKEKNDPDLYNKFNACMLHYKNLDSMSLRERSIEWNDQKEQTVRNKKTLKALEEELTPLKETVAELDREIAFERARLNGMLEEIRQYPDTKEKLEGEIEAVKMKLHTLGTKKSAPAKRIKRLEKLIQEMNDFLGSFRPLTNKNVFEGRAELQNSKDAIATYEAQYPEFKELEKDIWKYCDNLLQMRVDSGTITQADAETLRKLYPHYVPAFRAYPADSHKKSSDITVSKSMKRLEGGKPDIIDVFQAVAEQTQQVLKQGHTNLLANSVLRASENAQDKTWVKVLSMEDADPMELIDPPPEGKDLRPKENQIIFFRDGKKVTMAVSRELFKAFDGINTPSVEFDSSFARAAQWTNQWYKKLVTSLSPAFMLRNPIKDIQDAIINSKHRKLMLKNIPRAIRLITQNSKEWRMYRAMGGFSSSVFSMKEGFVSATGKRGFTGKRNLFEEERTGAKKLLHNLSVPARALFRKIENANAFVEQTTRFAEFLAAIEAGDSLQTAIYNSAEVTTNFGRRGRLTKKFNATIMPFLNPAIQGFDKLFRNVGDAIKGEDVVRALLNLFLAAAAVGIAPNVINYLMYGDDEEYKDLRDADKDNNFLVKLPSGDFLKIPRGRLAGVIGGTATRTIRAVKDGEGMEAFDGHLDNVVSQITPVENLTRSIASPIFDAINNVTWYGTAIEGREFDNTAPRDRYDENTSSLAIAFGQATGLSPKKVHYVMDQYSGVIGDFLLPLTTQKQEKDFISANFLIDPVSSNKLSSKFYEMYDEAQYAKTAGDDTAIYQVRYLNRVRDAVGELLDQKSEIQNSDLSGTEKLQQVRVINGLVNELYKTAMTDFDLYTEAFASSANIQNGQLYAHLFDEEMTEQTYQDLRFTEATRMTQGAESALEVYSKKVYAKSQLLNKVGVSYETYYNYYFATKGLESDVDRDGETVSGSKRKKIVEAIDALGVSEAEKLLLICAKGYSLQDGDVRGRSAEQAERMLLRYIVNRTDLTKSEKEELAKMCGFEVKNGRIVLKRAS